MPLDTDPRAFAVQVARWRAMTIVEKVTLIDQLNADVEQLAIAGICATHPGLDGAGIREELARRRFGPALTAEAYRHHLR